MFAKALRIRRMQAGLSQNALAKAAGIDPAYVNRLEHDKQSAGTPSRRVVLALARALGLGRLGTDEFLWRAGLSPEENWQVRALKAEHILEEFRYLLGVDRDTIPPPSSETSDPRRDG